MSWRRSTANCFKISLYSGSNTIMKPAFFSPFEFLYVSIIPAEGCFWSTTVSNVQAIALRYSQYGDRLILYFTELMSPCSPEGIHGSDGDFSLVLTCSHSRSSSRPWLYPQAASGFSKVQSPVTKGRNIYGYAIFPLTRRNEYIN